MDGNGLKTQKRITLSLGHYSRRNLISFISMIQRDNGCWNWIGAVHSGGYGQIRVNRKLMTAHRFSYEYFTEPIKNGLTIDHICRNKLCVNPDHLRTMTLQENILIGQNPAAINKRKTHCIRGHELSGSNLRLIFKKSDNKKYRNCIKCINLRSQVVKQRKKMRVVNSSNGAN